MAILWRDRTLAWNNVAPIQAPLVVKRSGARATEVAMCIRKMLLGATEEASTVVGSLESAKTWYQMVDIFAPRRLVTALRAVGGTRIVGLSR